MRWELAKRWIILTKYREVLGYSFPEVDVILIVDV